MGVPDLIDQSLGTLEAQARRRHRRDRHRLRGRGLGSAHSLSQVVVNLIENAIHAVKGVGHVGIEAHEAPEGVVVDVWDDGPGVALENRDRLFEPFFSTKRAGEGTGLGLAISREIAEATAGSSRCSPAITAPASASRCPGPTTRPIPEEGDGRSEPRHSLRRRRGLEPAGLRRTFEKQFRVWMAETGEEALAILEKEPVGVLLADQRLPGMLGTELLAIAKDKHPNVVRMVLTAYSEVETVLKTINEGLTSRYILKPWSRPMLQEVLSWGLDVHRFQTHVQELQLKLMKSERLSTMGTLLASVTHDIRNPLSYLCAYADTLGSAVTAFQGWVGAMQTDARFKSAFDLPQAPDMFDAAQGAPGGRHRHGARARYHHRHRPGHPEPGAPHQPHRAARQPRRDAAVRGQARGGRHRARRGKAAHRRPRRLRQDRPLHGRAFPGAPEPARRRRPGVRGQDRREADPRCRRGPSAAACSSRSSTRVPG